MQLCTNDREIKVFEIVIAFMLEPSFGSKGYGVICKTPLRNAIF